MFGGSALAFGDQLCMATHRRGTVSLSACRPKVSCSDQGAAIVLRNRIDQKKTEKKSTTLSKPRGESHTHTHTSTHAHARTHAHLYESQTQTFIVTTQLHEFPLNEFDPSFGP